MAQSDLEKFAYLGIFISVLITAVGLIQLDFGNEYGFTNETDTTFTNMINYTAVENTVESMEDDVLNSTPDPSFLGTLIDYGQFVMSGGYQLFKTIMSLPNILDGVIKNVFILFGIPVVLRGYAYAILTLAIIFASLAAAGVLKRT